MACELERARNLLSVVNMNCSVISVDFAQIYRFPIIRIIALDEDKSHEKHVTIGSQC